MVTCSAAKIRTASINLLTVESRSTANLDLRPVYTTETVCTYDVDELRQSQSELYGEFVAVVADRSDEFVVSVVNE